MRPILRKVGKWAVLGIAFTAIIVALPSKEGGIAKTVQHQAWGGTVPTVPASTAPARAGQRSPEEVRVELERLGRTPPEAGAEIDNVFGVISWYVPPPPPPPPPPAPPPAPTAPPLPFTYLGRYEDAPTRLAILVKGERMYPVSEGDVIEDTYRVERVTPGLVELIYLPLNIKQSLRTGEAL